MIRQMLNWNTDVVLAYNVPSIAAVAELELLNFKLRTNEQ